MKFLADESCDFAVVTALRAAGHDVSAIVELNPGAADDAVLELGRRESRVLLTEDKDFGVLAYAGGQQTAGVVLITEPVIATTSKQRQKQRAFIPSPPRRSPGLGTLGIRCSPTSNARPLHSASGFRAEIDGL